MGADKEWFEIIMKQANGSLMTALENQIQADVGVTREQANRVANHILDILDIANENKEQEIRNKAIGEFAEKLRPLLITCTDRLRLDEMAKRLKGGGE